MAEATQNEAPKQEPARIKEPQQQEVNISSKRDPKSYKLACKYALRKFGCVELRSLGHASEGVVALAQTLVHNKYAVFDKIESTLAEVTDDNEQERRNKKSIRFVVKLRKSPEFDELAKSLPPMD